MWHFVNRVSHIFIILYLFLIGFELKKDKQVENVKDKISLEELIETEVSTYLFR